MQTLKYLEIKHALYSKKYRHILIYARFFKK